MWIFTHITLINSSFKQKIKKLTCSSFLLVNFYIALVTEKAFIPSVLQFLFSVYVQLELALGDDPLRLDGDYSIQFISRLFLL